MGNFENIILKKLYKGTEDGFQVNGKEVLRYSGYMGLEASLDDGLKSVYDEVIADVNKVLEYKVCYRRMPIMLNDDVLMQNASSEDKSRKYIEDTFGFKSENLANLLTGCTEIVIFAATVGMGIDLYIKRNERLSATKALIAQGYGAERVEALCDRFCYDILDEAEREGLSITPRFSPGYGDVPLEAQTEFFRLLDCNRQVGISLNDSLLMTPSKSVTAIFGIGTIENIRCLKRRDSNIDKCQVCDKTECELRS